MKRPRLLGVLVAVGCLWQAGAFFFVALSRATYPFDLEWLEGLQLLQAREILVRHALYPAPSADFIPFVYEPLHALLLAAAGALFGLSYGVGRGLGIAATVVFAGATGLVVWRETRRRTYGALAAAGSFALFPASMFWLDLVHVDAVLLALLLVAFAWTRARAGTRAAPLTCAVALYVAFLAKQIAPLYAPVCLVAIYRRRGARAAGVFCACFLGLLVADGWIGDALTQGRYRFFTYHLPRAHFFEWHRVPLLGRVLLPAGIALAFAAAYAVARFRSARRATLFRRLLRAVDGWPLATACGLAGTFLAFVHVGGAINDVLSAYVVLPIVVAVVVHRASRLRTRPMLFPVALGLVGVQLAVFLYDPRFEVPSRETRAAAERFRRLVHDTPGAVLVPEHPFVAVLAGKEPSYHTQMLWEPALAGVGPPSDLRERLRDAKYDAVITSLDPRHAPPHVYPKELAARYAIVRELGWAKVLDARVGNQPTWPRYVLEPRPRR